MRYSPELLFNTPQRVFGEAQFSRIAETQITPSDRAKNSVRGVIKMRSKLNTDSVINKRKAVAQKPSEFSGQPKTLGLVAPLLSHSAEVLLSEMGDAILGYGARANNVNRGPNF